MYEESMENSTVPEDWASSYLKPLPTADKDHCQLNGYPIQKCRTHLENWWKAWWPRSWWETWKTEWCHYQAKKAFYLIDLIGKKQLPLLMRSMRDSGGSGNWSWRRLQSSGAQNSHESAVTVRRKQDPHLMDCYSNAWENSRSLVEGLKLSSTQKL